MPDSTARQAIVIKFGGHAMLNDELKVSFFRDMKTLQDRDFDVVVVHGGGPRISNMLSRLGIESSFHNGLRITDEATMEVTEMVLSGAVNKELVGLAGEVGIRAAGISGRDGNLIQARTMEVPENSEIDLGRVGTVRRVDPELVNILIHSGYLPIISPVSCGRGGANLNVNADHVAGAIASTLQASHLFFLTDVPGVMDATGRTLHHLGGQKARLLIDEGVIQSGMIPKVETCLEAVRSGVRCAHIIDGKKKHSTLEALDAGTSGTTITETCWGDHT